MIIYIPSKKLTTFEKESICTLKYCLHFNNLFPVKREHFFFKKHGNSKKSFFQYESKILDKLHFIETSTMPSEKVATSQNKPAGQTTPISLKRKPFDELCRTQKKRRIDNLKSELKQVRLIPMYKILWLSFIMILKFIT